MNVATFPQHPGERKVDYDRLEDWQPGSRFYFARNGEGTVTLSKLQGKAVILYFYPKDDTSGCTAEAIDFSALGGEFEAANAVVIGISPDSVKSHDKFAAKHSLSVMLASDEEKAVLEAYGVWKEKSMYGKKYMASNAPPSSWRPTEKSRKSGTR